MSRQFPSPIFNDKELITKLKIWRMRGDIIVFTNGCFDLLHAGHTYYLQEAALLGNRLIVGLNTDVSVKKLKGNKRPVIAENERAMQLAALHCVDAIVLFDEETPERLIEAVTPDILVKGGDYAAQEIMGSNYVIAKGGRIILIPLKDGYSTTTLIEKLRKIE